MFHSFLFGHVFAREHSLIILYLQDFFHLAGELSDLNELFDVVSDGNHLSIINAHDSNLNATSAHDLLEIFGHLLNTLRMNVALSDVDKDHLRLLVSKGSSSSTHSSSSFSFREGEKGENEREN